MRVICLILVVVSIITSCTSIRKMSRKFSDLPINITHQFQGEDYSNSANNIVKSYTKKPSSLWTTLSNYRTEQTVLPHIYENAKIQLLLVNHILKVTAIQNKEEIASFEIPVSKKGNYLILKNKIQIIPIPIFYWSIKEDKTILVPLANNNLGIHSYTDETLWILFFGASNTVRSINEYNRIN